MTILDQIIAQKKLEVAERKKLLSIPNLSVLILTVVLRLKRE